MQEMVVDFMSEFNNLKLVVLVWWLISSSLNESSEWFRNLRNVFLDIHIFKTDLADIGVLTKLRERIGWHGVIQCKFVNLYNGMLDLLILDAHI